MSLEEGEEYRCDREGYFDLDSLKPYASVWVSTRRDARSRTFQQDGETDSKKNVAPSRACNDLHSLLETNEPEGTAEGQGQDQVRSQTQLLSSTKSDHFPLNSYKLYEKNEGFTLRKISDKIIESMCKGDNKSGDDYSSPGSSSDTVSKEKISMHYMQQDQEDLGKEELKNNSIDFENTDEMSNMNSIKYQNKTEEESPIEKIIREPSRTSHLGGGDPQEDIKKLKLLSDSGKLISEIHLTNINVKDQGGREYPLTVKYVWEVDPNEVLNANESVFYSSPTFLKTIESISSTGMKLGKHQTDILSTKTSWQDKTKSQSNVSQRNRRFDSWNSEDRDHDSLINLNNKGDGPLRKGLGSNTQNVKNTLMRSKVSLAGPNQDKKLSDTPTDKSEVKTIESGVRDTSRINVTDKKTTLERKGKAPIKKKLPGAEEMKVPGSLTRPATFNKRDLILKPPATRPPSAPSREPRLTPRIGVQSSGDRLTQSLHKRPFGSSKHQSPPPAAGAGGKTWK